MRVWDISISPDGKDLPPGSGTAKQGAAIYAQKCSICHGTTGSEGPAPMLVKRQNPPANPGSCVAPFIRDATAMAMHAPYATVMRYYINRRIPFKQKSSFALAQVSSL